MGASLTFAKDLVHHLLTVYLVLQQPLKRGATKRYCEYIIQLNRTNHSTETCEITNIRLPRWLSGKEFTCHCSSLRRHRFNPWVGKIPWRRKWQPTPVFLPGENSGFPPLGIGSWYNGINYAIKY